ncbi:MAG: mechanosensitive ion channel family protein [Chloroflexota bacterium]
MPITALVGVTAVKLPFPSWPEFANHFRLTWADAAWAIIILIITYGGSRLASGRLRGVLEAGGFQVNVAILLARGLWLGLWSIGFILVLYQFGVGLAPLAAFIGILGLAASLSLQAVLQNLVAGVYLLAERPFRIGDYIAVVAPGGLQEGTVENIHMRTTSLRNRDDELILVPNSAVFSGVVTNRTAIGGVVFHLTVTFPRDTDLESTRQKILPILGGLSSILPNPQPSLRMEQVTTESWTASLSLWARTRDADSDAAHAIAEAFPEAGVSVGGAAP